MVFDDLKFRKDKHHHIRPDFGNMDRPVEQLRLPILVAYIILGVAMLLYASIGIFGSEFYIGKSNGILFKGPPATMLGISLVLASSNLFAKVIGHFAFKNYENFEKIAKYLAIALIVLAVLGEIFIWRQSVFPPVK